MLPQGIAMLVTERGGCEQVNKRDGEVALRGWKRMKGKGWIERRWAFGNGWRTDIRGPAAGSDVLSGFEGVEGEGAG
jgi:hypothetical protein